MRTVVLASHKQTLDCCLKEWLSRCATRISEKYIKKSASADKIPLSELMKSEPPKQENLQHSEDILCDPYKFLGVNKIFNRMITRLTLVRNKQEQREGLTATQTAAGGPKIQQEEGL
jgi:hypothetical protein